METVWVVAGLAAVVALRRRFPLTPLLTCLLAVWAVVLCYGGHYTYALTPLGDWAREAFGLARNPYDRLGHFMQGFVPAIAFRETLWRTSPLRGSRWLTPLTLTCCLSLSALWELLEWAGAYAVAGGSPDFLGGQGDPWDTQWDMLLALLGAALALLLLSRPHTRQLLALGDQEAVPSTRRRAVP
ncbi:inner membrane protein YjdF [Catellatospora sp. TT07R-123]|nr:inner membrane protein YjdF [Catellatospora sp. TT07R-123]